MKNQGVHFPGDGHVHLPGNGVDNYVVIDILGHIDLRGSLSSSEVIYLEYFFFVMYLAILAVSVNSILFVSYADVALIQYRDNFIPKQLYWPVITGILLAITLWVFY